METQTKPLERELETKIRREWAKQYSKKCKSLESFKTSLIYGLGVPALAVGLSYYSYPEQAEACGQVASWAYLLISPFVLINGMRYARHSGADDVLTNILVEAQNPGKTSLGSRGD